MEGEIKRRMFSESIYFHLLDGFGGTDVEVDSVSAVSQKFNSSLLSEPLSVYFTKDRLVVRLFVQTQS